MRKGITIGAALTAVLMIATTIVIAEDEDNAGNKPGRRMGQRGNGMFLAAADTDKNGEITFEEFKAFNDAHMQERFDRMDKNGDGVLTSADRPEGIGNRERARSKSRGPKTEE